MSNETRFNVTGDSSSAEKAFGRVGDASKAMADDVDKQSKRMASSTEDAGGKIAGAVDSSEGKFRGLGDVIGGTGDVMDGFKDGNVAQMAMGMADLAGGFTELVIPALTAMKTALVTGLAPAFTLISAHPLIAGILAGGAIIAGLFVLEKKFGLVSSAVDGLKGVFEAMWNVVKPIINGIIGGLEFIGNGALMSLQPLAKAANFLNPFGDVVNLPSKISLPRLHTGGIAGRDTLAVLQQGETVIPRGQPTGQGIVINVHGSVISERDLGRTIADALRNNKLIGVTS